MANSSFYDAILSAGENMQKTASEHDILTALENSDLSEEELNKLASDLEDALSEVGDIDDIEEEDNGEVLDNEGADADEENSDEEFSDESGNGDEGDGDADEDGAGEDGADESDSDEELSDDDVDLESLAAAYDAEYEKYASEGLTVRDYVYGQVDDEEFASVVGDMAEKLAYVAELPVFMVADDLITTISQKISEEQQG